MASELKKTIAPSGGDYTTLEACMDANEKNLVTSDEYFNVEITGDWSSTEDETNCVIQNYTTDATRFITIYATGTAKHDGTAYKSKAYEFKGADNTSSNFTIGAGGNYLVLKDFVVSGRGNAKQALYHATICATSVYDSMIWHNNSNGTGTLIVNARSTLILNNNIFFNVNRGVYSGSTSTTVQCLNCTAYGAASSQFGFLRIKCVNCYSGNFDSECFYSLSTGSDYCVASDTSASDECTNYTDSQSTYADYFESVTGGSEDFTLLNNTNTLWSLSGNSLSGTFTDDIIDTTRSAWDIGAFEFVGGEPPIVTIIKDLIYSGLIPSPR